MLREVVEDGVHCCEYLRAFDVGKMLLIPNCCYVAVISETWPQKRSPVRFLRKEKEYGKVVCRCEDSVFRDPRKEGATLVDGNLVRWGKQVLLFI